MPFLGDRTPETKVLFKNKMQQQQATCMSARQIPNPYSSVDIHVLVNRSPTQTMHGSEYRTVGGMDGPIMETNEQIPGLVQERLGQVDSEKETIAVWWCGRMGLGWASGRSGPCRVTGRWCNNPAD